ncbi:unnamed protein product, partial [Ectocarpus sp. 12 AP-2014]
PQAPSAYTTLSLSSTTLWVHGTASACRANTGPPPVWGISTPKTTKRRTRQLERYEKNEPCWWGKTNGIIICTAGILLYVLHARKDKKKTCHECTYALRPRVAFSILYPVPSSPVQPRPGMEAFWWSTGGSRNSRCLAPMTRPYQD